MACICKPFDLGGGLIQHTEACDYHNIALKKQEQRWENQEEPCSGSGYAHKPHGNCPGYTYDRT